MNNKRKSTFFATNKHIDSKYMEYFHELNKCIGNGPEVQIIFKNLSISNQNYNNNLNFKNISNQSKSNNLIIKNWNGTVSAGKMTLVLGPSQSGKSLFLKLVSGKIPVKNISGSLTYNGIKLQDLEHYNLDIKKIASFCGQTDLFYDHLSVYDSLKSICDKRNPDCFLTSNEKFLKFHSKQLDHILNVVGLTFVKNIKISFLSGGQKRRLSLAESLVFYPRILCLDEISNGLDSNTITNIVYYLQHWCKFTKGSVLCTLLQPTSEVFYTFDDLIVLKNKEIFFQNSRPMIVQYLNSLGIDPPLESDIVLVLSEYLENPEIVRNKYQNKYENEIKIMDINLMINERISKAENKDIKFKLNDNSVWNSLIKCQNQFNSKLFIAYLKTEMFIIESNKILIKKNILYFTIMAIFVSSISFNLSTEKFWDRFSLFYNCLLISMNSVIPFFLMQLKNKNVFIKYINNGMYDYKRYVISHFLTTSKWVIFQLLIIQNIIYCMTSFTLYFKEYCIFLLINLAFSLLSLIALESLLFSSLNEMISKQLYNLISTILLLFSGYVIDPEKLPKIFLSVYWLSPFSWGFRSLALNEFLSARYQNLASNSIGMLRYQGDIYLENFDIINDKNFILFCIIYYIGLFFLFLIIALKNASHLKYEKMTKTLVEIKTQTQDKIRVSTMKIDNNQSLCWKDISLRMKKNDKKYIYPSKLLLNNLSGYINNGMTALMGDSGSGKTTLLNVLSGRIKNCYNGEVTINGIQVSANIIKNKVGYVEQFDIFYPTQTVEEAIDFGLQINNLDYRDNLNFYLGMKKSIIESLELKPYLNYFCGSGIKKKEKVLSLSQKKLLAIAIELTKNTHFLFLDEPTSLLDSRSSLSIIKILKNLSSTGKIMLITIHQPTEDIFFLFDYLYLLGKNGRLMYFGEIGHKGNKIIEYFENLGFNNKIPYLVNPAVWMLQLINSKNTNIYWLLQKQRNQTISDKILEIQSQTRNINENILLKSINILIFFLNQINMLLKRSFNHQIRYTNFNLQRIKVIVFMAIVWGFISFQLEIDSFSSLNAKMFIFIHFSINILLFNSRTCLDYFIEEETIITKEVKSHAYSCYLYLFTTFISLFITNFIVCFPGFIVFYFLVGYNADMNSFFSTYIPFALSINVICFASMLYVFCSKNAVSASNMHDLIMTILGFLSGFFIKPETIPIYYKWIYWINIYPKLSKCFIISQFNCFATDILRCPTIVILKNGHIQNITISEYAISIWETSYDQYNNEISQIVLFLIVIIILLIANFTHKYNNI